MKTNFKLALALMLTFLVGNVAHAVVLDFSGITPGDTGSSSLTVGDATFDTVAGGNVYVYAPGGHFDNGGICALGTSFNCENDWTLTFDFAVTNFAFEAAVYNPIDIVQVEAFNGATSLGTIDVLAEGAFSFGSAVITSLYFADSSTGAGYAFGDFSYDRASVPEGGTLAFLAIGLLGLALQRRKQVI